MCWLVIIAKSCASYCGPWETKHVAPGNGTDSKHHVVVFTIPQNLTAVPLGTSHNFQRVLTPYLDERLPSLPTLRPNHLSIELPIGLQV